MTIAQNKTSETKVNAIKELLNENEWKLLCKLYNKQELTENDMKKIVDDFNKKKIENIEILTILNKFDADTNGEIDLNEEKELKNQIDLQQTQWRYAGYIGVVSRAFARSFRYLAFTSDFGEALRPVVSARIVNASYGIAFGYCFADVGIEAYKLHKRGYVTEKNHPMTMTQCIVERSAFQALASIAIPMLVIHTSVDVAKHALEMKMFENMKRLKKFGPSVFGLMVIPLLPMYLDEPVEKFVEWGFENYGPWSNKKSHHD